MLATQENLLAAPSYTCVHFLSPYGLETDAPVSWYARFIRGEHYLYEFTKVGSKAAKQGKWWKRKKVGSYFPPVTMESLEAFLKSNNWKIPKYKRKL